MGIENHAARFLVACRKEAVDFQHTATLGRQYFWANPSVLERICSEIDLEPPPTSIYELNYADDFFRWLGAVHLDSFDASPYENASLVWDMNLPLVDQHHLRYTAVVDIGTLEHVFNFPTAIQS